MDEAIGSRIKQLRTAKGWSQMRLSQEVGVSMRTIGTWEKTDRVPADQMPKLARALGVTADTFEDDPAAAPEAGFEISYRGWRMTFHPAPDATPEQVKAAERDIAQTVLARLQEIPDLPQSE